jgi:hypothetical protein
MAYISRWKSKDRNENHETMLIITCTNVIEVLYIIGKANGEVLINHLGTDLFDDWFIVFNATFSNISAISWWPVLVVEEAGPGGSTS